jgi:hypothetical protein
MMLSSRWIRLQYYGVDHRPSSSLSFRGYYPLVRQRLTSKWSVREHRFQNNAYLYPSNQIPTAMPSNRAKIDKGLIQPTQYNIQPDRKAKKPCPKR